jgi:RNase P subunit RPR2
MDAYCMKCKKKNQMTDPKAGKMANGRDCVTGTCSSCGTKMFKIGKMPGPGGK